MIAAEDMKGRDGLSVKALPHRKLQDIMKTYNRMK